MFWRRPVRRPTDFVGLQVDPWAKETKTGIERSLCWREEPENTATESLSEDTKGSGALAVGLKRESAHLGIQFPQDI